MKIVVKNVLIISLLIILNNLNTTRASEKKVSPEETEQLIESISQLMERNYISLEEAKKVNNLIKSKWQNGEYKNIEDPSKLAFRLTLDMQSINNDKHLSVHFINTTDSTSKKAIKSPVRVIVNEKGAWSNYGFQEVKVLDGNVGYLKISHFGEWTFFKEQKRAIDSSFNFLQNVDALIIDVQNNRGGYEEIVAYLISYFYDGEQVHLSDYFSRFNNQTKSLYTQTDIPGKKLPNMPIFILTNNSTASAAESLAYMLKHLKRATIIGEVTIGAGHGAMSFKASNRFNVTISSEITINAVTGTSFEQVGVQPDKKVSGDDIFIAGYTEVLDYLMHNNPKQIDTKYYANIKKLIPATKVKGNLEYQHYIGQYVTEGLEINVSYDKSNLFAKIAGKGTFKLIPTGNHVFIVDKAKVLIKFVLNKDNNVIKLVGVDSPMDLNKVLK